MTPAGPTIALLCHAYGWTPATVASLTGKQLAYFVEHIPEVELRRAWPAAQLEATIRNMMGGKRPPPKRDGGEPPLQAHELYTALDLLPAFATPDWANQNRRLSPEASGLVREHYGKMPAWVRALPEVSAAQTSEDAS